MNVAIKAIKVERKDLDTKRARKDYGDILSLADSIKKFGLLHPIIVDHSNDTNYDYVLVAGERRLRATILAGYDTIEVKLKESIDDFTRKEIELEENLQREDLHWTERIEALRQLDELKRKIYGDALKADPRKGKGKAWSVQDTAKSVGRSAGGVAEDIKLARELKASPSLKKKVARLPQHAAKKLVKQLNEASLLRKQIERRDLKIDTSLLQGNCVDLIKDIKNNSVHLLITDPPFAAPEIVKVSHTDKGGKSAPTYNLTESNVATEETMRDVYNILVPELYRVLVPGAHVYIFLGMYWYTPLISLLRKTGFIIDDSPLIWWKKRVSIMAKDNHYMSAYEAILFGRKPYIEDKDSRILNKPRGNVFDIPTIAPQIRVHPLMKPFDLLKIFIENSSKPGEVVLDCFAGSAMTLVASKKLQRRAIGFELDNGNYLRAQEFLSKQLGEQCRLALQELPP